MQDVFLKIADRQTQQDKKLKRKLEEFSKSKLRLKRLRKERKTHKEKLDLSNEKILAQKERIMQQKMELSDLLSVSKRLSCEMDCWRGICINELHGDFCVLYEVVRRHHSSFVGHFAYFNLRVSCKQGMTYLDKFLPDARSKLSCKLYVGDIVAARQLNRPRQSAESKVTKELHNEHWYKPYYEQWMNTPVTLCKVDSIICNQIRLVPHVMDGGKSFAGEVRKRCSWFLRKGNNHLNKNFIIKHRKDLWKIV